MQKKGWIAFCYKHENLHTYRVMWRKKLDMGPSEKNPIWPPKFKMAAIGGNRLRCAQHTQNKKVKGVGLESRHIGKPNQRTLLYPLAMISAYMQPATIDPTLDLCTRYPLLLGGQRQCGFKACPRLLHMTGAAGIEPQTSRSRVQRLNRSATRSTPKYGH